jgi:hypothetical protein
MGEELLVSVKGLAVGMMPQYVVARQAFFPYGVGDL